MKLTVRTTLAAFIAPLALATPSPVEAKLFNFASLDTTFEEPKK